MGCLVYQCQTVVCRRQWVPINQLLGGDSLCGLHPVLVAAAAAGFGLVVVVAVAAALVTEAIPVAAAAFVELVLEEAMAFS